MRLCTYRRAPKRAPYWLGIVSDFALVTSPAMLQKWEINTPPQHLPPTPPDLLPSAAAFFVFCFSAYPQHQRPKSGQRITVLLAFFFRRVVGRTTSLRFMIWDTKMDDQIFWPEIVSGTGQNYTHSSPMKIGLPQRKLGFQPSIFTCYISFREDRCVKHFDFGILSCCGDSYLTLTLDFSLHFSRKK